ncbi:MAG: hypothetical protein ACLTIW_14095 [Blautia sp.]|uniref:hypothetical protein n=1 Tax=Hominenteromicrobium sp. TaxID=3073581 RepID=UPI003991B36B
MSFNQYATIIAYIDDLAICEDDFGDLWYADIPESCAEPGAAIEIQILHRLDALPESDQQSILRQIDAQASQAGGV